MRAHLVERVRALLLIALVNEAVAPADSAERKVGCALALGLVACSAADVRKCTAHLVQDVDAPEALLFSGSQDFSILQRDTATGQVCVRACARRPSRRGAVSARRCAGCAEAAGP